MKVSTELGYMNIPDGVLMDLNQIKSLPKNRVCIITTGSQGRPCPPCPAWPSPPTGRWISSRGSDHHLCLRHPGQRALYWQRHQRALPQGGGGAQRAGAGPPRVGHACQEELKIIHALVKPQVLHPGPRRAAHAPDPRKAGPGDGDGLQSYPHQRHRPGHGTDPEQRPSGGHCHCRPGLCGRFGSGRRGQRSAAGPPPSGPGRHDRGGHVHVWGEDGSLVSGPDLITRGFVYVKESEGLMEELRQVALEAINSVDARYSTDWSAIKGAVKGDLSNYLYKKTSAPP